jgi:hypothetical protein
MHAWILTLLACAGIDENISDQSKQTVITAIQIFLLVISCSRVIILIMTRLLVFPKDVTILFACIVTFLDTLERKEERGACWFKEIASFLCS